MKKTPCSNNITFVCLFLISMWFCTVRYIPLCAYQCYAPIGQSMGIIWRFDWRQCPNSQEIDYLRLHSWSVGVKSLVIFQREWIVWTAPLWEQLTFPHHAPLQPDLGVDGT